MIKTIAKLLPFYAILITTVVIPYRFLVLYKDHRYLAITLFVLISTALFLAIKAEEKIFLYIYCCFFTVMIFLALTGLVFIPYTY